MISEISILFAFFSFFSLFNVALINFVFSADSISIPSDLLTVVRLNRSSFTEVLLQEFYNRTAAKRIIRPLLLDICQAPVEVQT